MITCGTPRSTARSAAGRTPQARPHLPRQRLLAPASRGIPGLLFPRVAALRPQDTLFPSPAPPSAQGSPSGVSWVSQVCEGDVRGVNSPGPCGNWGAFTSERCSDLYFLACNFSCSHRSGESTVQLLDFSFIFSRELEGIWGSRSHPRVLPTWELRLGMGRVHPGSQSAFAERPLRRPRVRTRGEGGGARCRSC